MSVRARQLPLPLPARSAQGAADFLVAESNAAAVRWLDAWPDWPGMGLLLYGPPASGKSHLAAIWAGRAGATVTSARGLGREQALGATAPMAVDDVDRLRDPTALFHLINTLQGAGHTFLLTAAAPVSRWSTGLADLDSRLRALPAVGLEAPDDTLLAGLAAKLFADRQITVPDAVIAYMLTHMERSCAAIAAAVDRLDRASLAQRRKISRQLAQEILTPPEPRSTEE